jgi:hypothetical protein
MMTAETNQVKAGKYLIAELHPPYDMDAFADHCRTAGLRRTLSKTLCQGNW